LAFPEFEKICPVPKKYIYVRGLGNRTAILPASGQKDSFIPVLLLAFCFTFGIVFIRSAMSDILEMQRDKLIGQETIPVFFGRERPLNVLRVIL